MPAPDELAAFLARHPVAAFDLDGVIANSNELKVACIRDALSSFPADLVEEFVVSFRATFGRSRREHFAAFYAEQLGLTGAGADFDAFYEKYAGAYADLLAERYLGAPLCAHAGELIPEVAAAGVPLYLVTGTLTAEAVAVLRHHGLSGWFRGVLGGEQHKAARLTAILSETGAAGPDVVLVGDARQDALAADAAGTGFLLVTRYGFYPPGRVLADGAARDAWLVETLHPRAAVRRAADVIARAGP